MLRSQALVSVASASAAAMLAGLLAAGAPAAHAERWIVVTEPDQPMQKSEAWAGADATLHAWSVYVGSTYAPFGDVRSDGLRIRSAGGVGAYSYTSPRFDGVSGVPVHFKGTQSYADLLLGWQQTLGPWTIKAFAGASRETHTLTPFDDENEVQGERIGLKAALETWLSLGDWAFVQSEASWSEAFAARGARVRTGYRLNPAWSTGVEAAYVGNANYEAGRLGAFGRFEWTRGEISLSGGIAGDRSGDAGAYGSIGLLYRF